MLVRISLYPTLLFDFISDLDRAWKDTARTMSRRKFCMEYKLDKAKLIAVLGVLGLLSYKSFI